MLEIRQETDTDCREADEQTYRLWALYLDGVRVFSTEDAAFLTVSPMTAAEEGDVIVISADRNRQEFVESPLYLFVERTWNGFALLTSDKFVHDRSTRRVLTELSVEEWQTAVSAIA